MDVPASRVGAAAGQTGTFVEFAGSQPPRVAVVIGCYNQAAYVEAAIRSVAAQSYGHFECVVIDDSSSDGSAAQIQEVLESLSDPRFRALPRSENGGQMVTMLDGLDATSGPFTAFLDADDLWHPAFLERHILAHTSARGIAALSCSNLVVIDEEAIQLSGGKPNFFWSDPGRRRRKAIVAEEETDSEGRTFIAPETSTNWLWSSTSGMMFRRTVLSVLRPARPERLRFCADHYLANGAHSLGGTVRIERSLGCYRLHGNNKLAHSRLLGCRTTLGRPPTDIVVASREEFVRCLCDKAELLVATLPASYVARLLIDQVGWKRSFALAASNPGAKLILSGARRDRFRVHLRKIRHRLARLLASKDGRPKNSR